jgi:N-acetylglucosaminyldiphosphoundecaprenol N-acetyl-beta-D-mannosaminyltransferase
MNPIETSPVLGVPLLVGDYARAAEIAREWAGRADRPYLIAAANTHVVTLAAGDAEFAESLASFDLVLPDGMPLVWVMNRQLREPLRDRIYGPTFMLRCLEGTQGAPWSHMLVGGSEALLAQLATRLQERFPGLVIAGTYAPPFGAWPASEDARMVAAIRASGAQLVWVGLGCPKQEHWLARQRAQLPPGVYAAVGAAFAFHAGWTRQAPRWMQRAGLEWLFRLGTEPRRLWRRYLVNNPLFVWKLLAERCCGRRRS